MISLRLDGTDFTSWTEAEVSLDIEDFSGTFSFTLREFIRAGETFDYASMAEAYLTRPGAAVEISVDGALVLVGWVDKVAPDISEGQASVTITGRDKSGDLVDSSALVEGAPEYKNVKLEDAANRIALPFGLKVRSEIDTGDPFERYSLDLSETAFSAIEKGARSRQAHVLSDGVGGIVITRTGKARAPADLTLPGNVLAASGEFDHEHRHSKTIVRGQSEKLGKDRTAEPLISRDDTPKAPDDRQPGDGGATDQERKGTTGTGQSTDDEITRYRPIVHLARSKANSKSAQDEADWRMRTARGQSERITYTVRGHTVSGRPWRINELAAVADNFLQVFRDKLITRVTFRQNEGDGDKTELCTISPEAFDNKSVGDRRTNKKSGKSKSLDTTATSL